MFSLLGTFRITGSQLLFPQAAIGGLADKNFSGRNLTVNERKMDLTQISKLKRKIRGNPSPFLSDRFKFGEVGR
jgi:hypothetical protein